MEIPILLATISTAFIGFIFIFKFYFMKAVKCKDPTRLDGKTVIITGANRGIGKETAINLAKRGGRIIFACRDISKAAQTIREIDELVPGAELLAKELDLSSLTSVRKFAEDILKTEKSLNILINNAGIGGIPRSLTEDGFEMTFAVNHLGHFLLTNVLMPLLKSSAPSRIINVSAHAHVFYNMDFTDLMMERSYGSIKAYCRSKLANVLFTRELSKRLAGSGVATYALHPGVIHTGFCQHLAIMRIPGIYAMYNFTSRNLFKTPKEGCQTTVYCAVSDQLGSGMYYSNCGISMPMMSALHEGHAKLLWRRSAELVGIPYEERVEPTEDEDEQEETDSEVEDSNDYNN